MHAILLHFSVYTYRIFVFWYQKWQVKMNCAHSHYFNLCTITFPCTICTQFGREDKSYVQRMYILHICTLKALVLLHASVSPSLYMVRNADYCILLSTPDEHCHGCKIVWTSISCSLILFCCMLTLILQFPQTETFMCTWIMVSKIFITDSVK